VVEGDRLRGWGPRLLAPLAFFVAATVLILLVHNALSRDSPSPAVTPPGVTQTGPAATGTEQTATGKQRKKRRFYVIQPGDTFGTIAERFNTTVNELEVLNPGVDSASLTVGQRVRVR
jgi:LysM repeat protein